MPSHARADLVLHPVRVNIVREFSGGQQLTAQEVAAALPEVPAATLYRHISLLMEGGVLSVVGMRRARGAPERVLELVSKAVHFTADDFRKFTRQEMRRYFVAFMASLIDAGERYIGSRGARGDELRYRFEIGHMTDAEHADFLAERDALFAKIMARAPSPDRRPRAIAILSSLHATPQVPPKNGTKKRRA
jgi:hypothetical protein